MRFDLFKTGLYINTKCLNFQWIQIILYHIISAGFVNLFVIGSCFPTISDGKSSQMERHENGFWNEWNLWVKTGFEKIRYLVFSSNFNEWIPYSNEKVKFRWNFFVGVVINFHIWKDTSSVITSHDLYSSLEYPNLVSGKSQN